MLQSPDRFLLTSDESELLLEFGSRRSTQALAEKIGRDHSIVSRSLKRIAEKLPVLEKKGGKWILTELGIRFNENTRNAIHGQISLAKNQSVLRIGTNREFASRVLAPDFKRLRSLFPESKLIVDTYENGTEKALLEGSIDIGFDCNRPNDPELAYKLILEEPIVVVAGNDFAKKYKKEIVDGDYLKLPHLQCLRLAPDKIFEKSSNTQNVIASFNDIATARAVCIASHGWALLPYYCVKNELENKSLVQIDQRTFKGTKYGVWWLRRRSYIKDSVNKAIDWLSANTLE